MTLDLALPAHREALAWACDTLICTPSVMAYWSAADEREGHPRNAALHALSSPEQSAAIVRALAGKHVADVCVDEPDDWISIVGSREPYFIAVEWPTGAYDVERRELSQQHAVALIRALLAATTPAEALAALREAGR